MSISQCVFITYLLPGRCIIPRIFTCLSPIFIFAFPLWMRTVILAIQRRFSLIVSILVMIHLYGFFRLLFDLYKVLIYVCSVLLKFGDFIVLCVLPPPFGTYQIVYQKLCSSYPEIRLILCKDSEVL